MSKLESTIQREIRLKMSEEKCPFFRNNVGTGWAGSKVVHHGNGSVTVINARPLHAGLCVGSSDLIGIIPHTVTQEDVGKTFGIFTALETKQVKDNTEKKRKESQGNFLRRVNELGGLGAVVRSAEDAESVVREKWDSEVVRKFV